MNKISKLTVIAILIVIFGNAIANANDKHDKIRVLPIDDSNWNVVYNYSKCWTHYVYGETKQEAIDNYFSNTRSIGYNKIDCITEGEDA